MPKPRITLPKKSKPRISPHNPFWMASPRQHPLSSLILGAKPKPPFKPNARSDPSKPKSIASTMARKKPSKTSKKAKQ